jgi:hypothetical protein
MLCQLLPVVQSPSVANKRERVQSQSRLDFFSHLSPETSKSTALTTPPLRLVQYIPGQDAVIDAHQIVGGPNDLVHVEFAELKAILQKWLHLEEVGGN